MDIKNLWKGVKKILVVLFAITLISFVLITEISYFREGFNVIGRITVLLILAKLFGIK